MIAISISRFVLHLCWHVMDVQEQIPRNLISIGISCIGLNSLKLLDAKSDQTCSQGILHAYSKYFWVQCFGNWNVKYLYRSSGRTLQMAL